MNETDEKLIALAERLMHAGDHRGARQTALRVTKDSDLNPENSARLARVLRATGIDPFAVAILLLTLGVLTFLIVKYAL